MKDQTVGSVIRNVLPTGSVELPDYKVEGTISLTWKWEICPLFPMDVFAVAAYLLKVGGVIAFFEPSPFAEKGDLSRGQFVLSTTDRILADTAGEMWRDVEKNPKGFPPNYVQILWRQLLRRWDDPVTPGSYLGDDADNSKWWSVALKLVIISDMACNRILRDPVGPFKRSPFEEFVEDWYLIPYREDDKLSQTHRRRDGASGMETPRPPASLTLLADRSVVCVLPKVRVAPVGATLRNLTRNLSLLPGRGEVRCSWYDLPEPANGEDQETLDILLIPEPATLEAKCFRPHEDAQETQKNLHYWKKDWDNFHLDQTWIKGKAKRELFLKN